jgi:AcrR family transcriptional regulator
MTSTGPSLGESPAMSGRDLRRLETRARLFDAAVAEIGRVGLPGADVSTITRAIGVARGTFYFHFPTKEHVLVELHHAEEAKIVARLKDRTAHDATLESMLKAVTGELLAAERRLGDVMFRDMLALVFSSTRPADARLEDHPLAQYVVDVISQAQRDGRLPKRSDPHQFALIFLTGMFALLTTRPSSRDSGKNILNIYVRTIVSGMEVR